MLRLPFHTLLLQLTLRGAELFQLALPPKRSESLTEHRSFNPVSHGSEHTSHWVCCRVATRIVCARLAAALLRLQRSLLRLRRDECLGPTANVAIAIQHTDGTVDITRSGNVPISAAAKTHREPCFLFINIREPIT